MMPWCAGGLTELSPEAWPATTGVRAEAFDRDPDRSLSVSARPRETSRPALYRPPASLSSPARRAGITGPDRDRSVPSDMEAFAHTVGHGWTQPLRWDGGDWLLAGGVLALGVGTAFLDDEIHSLFDHDPERFMENVNDVGYHYGRPHTQLAGGLALYVPGAVAGSDWLRDSGQMILANVFVAGIPQQTARLLAGRARPQITTDNARFDPFNLDNGYAGFISGHVALAVGSSVILSRQIDHPVATAGLAVLALSTPAHRLYHEEHWASDVVVGMLLGWFSGNFVYDFHQRHEGLAERLFVTPTAEGLALGVRF